MSYTEFGSEPTATIFYLTESDFALTTFRAIGEAESGPSIRKIGLAEPWEDEEGWKGLVSEALQETARKPRRMAHRRGRQQAA